MKLPATALDKMELIAGEVNGNRRVVLQNADGRDFAAIIPIEDLYLLQKLDDCLNILKPNSRFPEHVKNRPS
jgi:hypothetical protein